ncbi:MAG: YkgJ family cysteine cluster protein [Nitrospirae bacterium]|nr:YkgJ family cysteine cluster protein [Nitrospirota bacterium]MDW7728072.1 YkgJ family cysteine cluster protein [Candidatus Methanoperedens sp.]
MVSGMDIIKRRIAHLKKTLEKALEIDETRLACEIKETGFKCIQCGKCCRQHYGDNTVAVFPFEVWRICKQTGLKWKDVVIPTPSEDMDSEGNIHTFEWVLRKNGDCIFLEGGICSVYKNRPYICKTYPFYLYEGRLMVCECDGHGKSMDDLESREMASLLKERYITEIKESISLLEKFNGFSPGGRGNVCVHDSEGEHWLTL